MRALIQRVEKAVVEVGGAHVGACNCGLLILLGVGTLDEHAQAQRLWKKILSLRIFADKHGKTNLSLTDVKGEVLIVSQFTLYADARKGNRPSFTQAASADKGRELYDYFVALAQTDLGSEHVSSGIFGADMRVSLVNDGPFTIMLDTDELTRS